MALSQPQHCVLLNIKLCNWHTVQRNHQQAIGRFRRESPSKFSTYMLHHAVAPLYNGGRKWNGQDALDKTPQILIQVLNLH